MIKRYSITCIFFVAAVIAAYSYYTNTNDSPWTRDGQVRANIIQITPRVTGQITEINVMDNAYVKKDELLFKVDQRTYQVALSKALASQHQAMALLKKSKDEANRSNDLVQRSDGALSTLTLNNLENAVEIAKANLAIANAVVDDAQLKLEYTSVVAPTDGYIANLNFQVGSQVIANTPVVALIDAHSFWVEGFFKETDLVGVSKNNKAQVMLLSNENQIIEGVVDSIGFGIATTDGTTGDSMLPNVNPNFQWIRLAQRLPVKIKLTKLPENVQLRVGITASVKIIKNMVNES